MKTSNGAAGMNAMSRIFDDCLVDAVAITSEGDSVLFGELADSVHFVADRLRVAGVSAAEQVGLLHDEGVRAVIAMTALASIGATVVVLDARDDPDYLTHRLNASRVHFVMTDVSVEHVLDEICGGVIPSVVAEDYALVRVGCGVATAASEVVYFEDERVVRRSWALVFDDAARTGRDAEFDANSTVTVSESLSVPASLTILVAALLAGSTVSLYEPIDAADAPCAVAARLSVDGVSLLAGSASYMESLVRSGVVGLLPISSLTDVVVVDGRIGDVFRGVFAAAMPTVRVIHSAEASLMYA